MVVSALIILEGDVQGVGLRYKARTMARRLKIFGCIENLKDDTVKISCSGEKKDIEAFIVQLKGLEEPVFVDNVDVEYSEGVKHSGMFKIIPGNMESELVEGFATGAMYLDRINQKQDIMIEKQDTMLEKQDTTISEIQNIGSMTRTMLEKQDTMLEKQDTTISEIQNLGSMTRTMLEKQDTTISEIQNLGSTTRDMLDSRFERIEKDISKIKEKLAI